MSYEIPETMNIHCCCTPENVLGEIDTEEGLKNGLSIRQLDDLSFAFSSEERPVSEFESIPTFRKARRGSGGKKTWRKTWRKK